MDLNENLTPERALEEIKHALSVDDRTMGRLLRSYDKEFGCVDRLHQSAQLGTMLEGLMGPPSQGEDRAAQTEMAHHMSTLVGILIKLNISTDHIDAAHKVSTWERLKPFFDAAKRPEPKKPLMDK